MLWRETVRKTAGYLGAKSVPDPETAAELLAARLLRVGRGTLASRLDAETPEKCLEAMRRAMARLVSGEPLQHVLGEWDFRTLTLSCDRRALIPRPETEGLAGLAIERLRSRPAGSPVPLVVDVGTGSGAIALSIAAECETPVAIVATDVSPDAIALATENARRCGLEGRVKFAVADGLDDFDEPQCIDMIVSNPPYVRTADVAALDRRVRDFEPRLALDGGETGLDFYERYLGDAVNLLKPGGAVLFEIGCDQGADLRRMMEAYGLEGVEIRRDLSGLDRYALGTLP